MTCQHCGRDSRNGAVCLNCRRDTHRWKAINTGHYVCERCLTQMAVFRRYRKGDKGSTWKRSYNGVIGKSNKCNGGRNGTDSVS